jgi:hypothetical protein
MRSLESRLRLQNHVGLDLERRSHVCMCSMRRSRFVESVLLGRFNGDGRCGFALEAVVNKREEDD